MFRAEYQNSPAPRGWNFGDFSFINFRNFYNLGFWKGYFGCRSCSLKISKIFLITFEFRQSNFNFNSIFKWLRMNLCVILIRLQASLQDSPRHQSIFHETSKMIMRLMADMTMAPWGGHHDCQNKEKSTDCLSCQQVATWNHLACRYEKQIWEYWIFNFFKWNIKLFENSE